MLREDLFKNYRTKIIVVGDAEDKKTFEIQSVDLGQLWLAAGNPIIPGIGSEKVSDEERAKMVASEEFYNFMKKVCCAGLMSITNIKGEECIWVDKSPSKCKDTEVSVRLLKYNEVIAIGNEIAELSMSEREVEQAKKFREFNGEPRREGMVESASSDEPSLREAAV